MKISNLGKTYKTKYETVNALKDINLNLPNSGLVFIVGASGSGKTTLMNMLSGVDRPSTGNIYIVDEPLFNDDEKQMFGYRNSYVGLIFQDYNLIEDLNVYDNIKLTLELMGRDDFAIVDEVIKLVDIEEIKYSKVNEISSGQMQRVAIARTIVKGSSIILADEPTGNLDSKNEKIVFDLLKDISKERLVVVITHDDDAAEEYGDRIIRIEDGEIIEDDHPLTEVPKEIKPEFIEPKIKFKQQAKFTRGFIRNNLGRSLSIFLVLLLIPIIGGILASYVFFDISTSYKGFQNKYGSEYLALSKQYNDSNIYYNSEDFNDLIMKYPGSFFIDQYDTWIDINPESRMEEDFFVPVIKNIIIADYRMNIVGEKPKTDNEILISDYVLASIEYYQRRKDVKTIEIDGTIYDIVGVVNTDYEDFLVADFTNEYVKMAFEENLNFYNAIYTTYSGYYYMLDQMTSYRESISVTLSTANSVTPVTKYADVIVTKNGGQSLLAGRYHGKREAIISSALFYDALDMKISDLGNRRVFYTYTKSRYSIAPDISGIFESDENIIVVHESEFKEYVERFRYGRLLIRQNDVNYDKIVREENVTNLSFEYASAMWKKTKDSQIVMLEFLIVLVLVMASFSVIVNSITVNAEKKKIGIKYSFGMKKVPIIVPYILETLLYIIISLISSIIIVKWVFPWFMKTIVYTDPIDIKAFDFFYISWSTIIGWDILIYGIMILSLTWMIFKILVKSPIEIIKDL